MQKPNKFQCLKCNKTYDRAYLTKCLYLSGNGWIERAKEEGKEGPDLRVLMRDLNMKNINAC